MGCDTKFYFANRVNPFDIAIAIENEYKIKPDMSNIRFEASRYDGDYDRYCGYIRFTLNGFKHSFHFYQHNHISGGKRDRTHPDTISGYSCSENAEVFEKIGKYFGGWLDVNDCDDEDLDIFIKKTVNSEESTNQQKLEQLICSKIDFKYADKVINFLQEEKETLKKLLFE